MKKYFLLLFLAFQFSQIKASHEYSSNLTWEVQANGQYVFTVERFIDCTGSTGINLTLNNNAGLSITLAHIQTTVVSPSCYSSSLELSCAGSGFFADFGVVRRSVFRSSPITIVGTPPVGGWVFNTSQCCKHSGTNLLNPSSNSVVSIGVIHSNGVGKSSPQILAHEPWVFDSGDTCNVNFNMSNAGDSSFYSLESSFSSVVSNVPIASAYIAGYSATSPLPNTSMNSANMPLTLDSETGMAQFCSYTQGSYVVNVKVESYENGNLINVVYREKVINVRSNSNTNSPPKVTVANNASGVLTKQSDMHYSYSGIISDTMDLSFVATDSDMNGNSFQNLSFAMINGDTNCVTGLCASTQLSSTSPGSLVVDFKVSKNPNSTTSQKGTFLFKWIDDFCPVPESHIIRLDVDLGSIIQVQDYFSVCKGSYVQPKVTGDTANLLWTPNLFINSVSSASPIIAPDSTTVYTVTELVSGETHQVTVHVGQDSTKPVVIDNSLYFYCANAAAFDTIIWNYNGLDIVIGDTMPNLGGGTYFCKGIASPCTNNSDPIIAVMKTSVSFTGLGLGATINSSSLPGSYMLNMYCNYNTNTDSIIMLAPTSGSKKTNYKYTLTVLDGSNVIYKDSLKESNGAYVVFKPVLNLNGGAYYDLIVKTDNPEFKVYDSGSYPSATRPGLYVITKSEFKAKGQTGLVSSGFPFLIFHNQSAIGVGENTIGEIAVLPNPANEFIIIQSENIVEFELYDVSGKVMMNQKVLPNERVDISDIAIGLYIYRITSPNGISTGKLIKE